MTRTTILLLLLAACQPQMPDDRFSIPAEKPRAPGYFPDLYPECQDATEIGIVAQAGCIEHCLPATTAAILCTDNDQLPAMLPALVPALPQYVKAKFPADPNCPDGWVIYAPVSPDRQKEQSYFNDTTYTWGYVFSAKRPVCTIDTTLPADTGFFGRHNKDHSFLYVERAMINEQFQ